MRAQGCRERLEGEKEEKTGEEKKKTSSDFSKKSNILLMKKRKVGSLVSLNDLAETSGLEGLICQNIPFLFLWGFTVFCCNTWKLI